MSLTASLAEDRDPFEEETDVKPAVLPPPSEEDQQEDVKVTVDSLLSSSSPSSEATAAMGERPDSSGVFYNKHQSMTGIHSWTLDVRTLFFFMTYLARGMHNMRLFQLIPITDNLFLLTKLIISHFCI